MGIFNNFPKRDHIGHIRTGERGQKGVDGVGFKLTDDGNYDIENKKLTNVGEPQSNQDAATKKYVDDNSSSITQLSNLIKKDGTVAMTGDLDMGENLITRMGYPQDILDATNKSYVDSEIASCLKRDRTDPALGDLEMNGHAIENLKDADNSTPATEAINKKYVDQGLQTKLDAIAQMPLNMNNEQINNLGPPTSNSDVVTKQYADTSFLKRDGSTAMYGDLSLANHKITDVGAPSADKDAANKIYVDQAPFLKRSGRQMTGDIDMGENTLANLKDPVAASSGATKRDVDATHVDASGTARKKTPSNTSWKTLTNLLPKTTLQCTALVAFRRRPTK